MRCEKCMTETNKGGNYSFYYGTFTGSSRFDRHITFQHFRIGGSENVFLCDDCVNRQINRFALLIGSVFSLIALAFSVLRLFVGGPAPEGSSLETIIGFPIALVGGPLLYLGISRSWKRGKNREIMGDSLAIQLRKNNLKSKGYTKFFTRENYKGLY